MTEVVNDQEVSSATASDEPAPKARLDLRVNIDDVGPCKKHVRVGIPRVAIDEMSDKLVDDYSDKVQVPGFRVGHVPADLVRKRFRKELSEEVKQKILLQSLEQIGEESELEPIGEPNLDLENIEIPEEGDFEYEFEIEVRPKFDLPDYKNLSIERPTRELTDEDVDNYLTRYLDQYGTQHPVEEPAQAGDFLSVDIVCTRNGEELARISDVSLRLLPTLRFQDAQVDHFDQVLVGASADDVRETDVTVSMEAENIELRGEQVHLTITVLDVKRLERPTVDEDFLDRLNADSLDDLKAQIRGMLERQIRYEQRQSCRRQVIEQITDAGNWELPEDLLRRQTENALRREVLEMQQAGFTTQEIMARENDLRQRSLTMTRRNLKEHFVLDKIAEIEKIVVSAEDIDGEIYAMAMQRGENPRRVRARMAKSGMLENLDAQIRERKAVDVILAHAKFTDTVMDPPAEPNVEALNRSVCRSVVSLDTDAVDDTNEGDAEA